MVASIPMHTFIPRCVICPTVSVSRDLALTRGVVMLVWRIGGESARQTWEAEKEWSEVHLDAAAGFSRHSRISSGKGGGSQAFLCHKGGGLFSENFGHGG